MKPPTREVARLADVEQIVDQLGPADRRRLAHHPDQRVPQLVVGGDPVADDRQVRLQPLEAHQLRDGPIRPGVVAHEVGDGAAVGVAARQRDEVLGRRPSIGLWTEALQDAGRRHAAHRVDRAARGRSRRPAGRPRRRCSRWRTRSRPPAPISWSFTPCATTMVSVVKMRASVRRRIASRLHLAQVLAAVVEVRLELEAVELEVDLDPVAQPCERGEEPVVARDPDAVRVEQHAGDLALDGGLG